MSLRLETRSDDAGAALARGGPRRVRAGLRTWLHSGGFLPFFVRRLSYAVPQIIGVTFLTFVIIRLLPANPARAILGPYSTPEGVARITHDYGLDRPVWEQYWIYMRGVLHGDLGVSWQTSHSVASDLASRIPSTLELTTISLLAAVAIGVPLGTLVARGNSRIAKRLAGGYGLIAGALPEFWVALILIFVIYVKWQPAWIPAPSGQLDFTQVPPPKHTGATLIDSLIDGDFGLFRSALAHLILPVATLVIVLVGPILKITRSTVSGFMQSDFVWYMGACGYPGGRILRRALRNALPVILTVIAILYAYLLGGAVLVETVFSWGGAGQYAIQSIQHADLLATQGFVLAAGAFTVVVYFILDIINAAIDPRLTNEGER